MYDHRVLRGTPPRNFFLYDFRVWATNVYANKRDLSTSREKIYSTPNKINQLPAITNDYCHRSIIVYHCRINSVSRTTEFDICFRLLCTIEREMTKLVDSNGVIVEQSTDIAFDYCPKNITPFYFHIIVLC